MLMKTAGFLTVVAYSIYQWPKVYLILGTTSLLLSWYVLDWHWRLERGC